MTAREVLDGIKARLAGATPGPWRTGPAQQPKFAAVESHVYSPRGSHILLGPTDGNAGQAKNGDAVFIAAAPTDVARLTRAVEAVLDLHEHRNGVWRDRSGQGWEGDYCLECKVEFPCDTVDNLTHALAPK